MRRLILTALLFVAACASPAERITQTLVDRGVPQRQAKCMGDRLGDRLSLEQLKRLKTLSKVEPSRSGHFSIKRLADALDQQGDPKLVTEVMGAGLSCLI